MNAPDRALLSRTELAAACLHATRAHLSALRRCAAWRRLASQCVSPCTSRIHPRPCLALSFGGLHLQPHAAGTSTRCHACVAAALAELSVRVALQGRLVSANRCRVCSYAIAPLVSVWLKVHAEPRCQWEPGGARSHSRTKLEHALPCVCTAPSVEVQFRFRGARRIAAMTLWVTAAPYNSHPKTSAAVTAGNLGCCHITASSLWPRACMAQCDSAGCAAHLCIAWLHGCMVAWLHASATLQDRTPKVQPGG